MDLGICMSYCAVTLPHIRPYMPGQSLTIMTHTLDLIK